MALPHPWVAEASSAGLWLHDVPILSPLLPCWVLPQAGMLFEPSSVGLTRCEVMGSVGSPYTPGATTDGYLPAARRTEEGLGYSHHS